MGYNTTIVFLNDATHLIEEDKDFPRNLRLAILAMASGYGARIDVPVLYHANACQVIAQEHADVETIIGVGGNTGHIIGKASCYNSNHTILRRLAEQHGFNLVPKKTRGVARVLCEDCTAGTPIGTCYDCGKILDKNGNCPDEPLRHRR